MFSETGFSEQVSNDIPQILYRDKCEEITSEDLYYNSGYFQIVVFYLAHLNTDYAFVGITVLENLSR
jgi:predicted Zn-dependent protease